MRTTRRRLSLRLRITAGALVVLVAALCGAGVVVVQVVERKMVQQIDTGLRADANFIQRAMTRGSGLPMGEGPTDLYVQFLAADGRVVGAGTAATGLPPLAPPHQSTASRIETRHDPARGDLRVLAQRAPLDPTETLVVARSSNSVRQMRDSLIGLLAVLVVLGSVALGWLIWLVVGRALRPVDKMRESVDSIGERDLHRRVIPPGTGDELDELAGTLNGLLGRIDAAMTRENTFVADASHELRTPIAGVRALLETEPTDAESVLRIRVEALARIGELQDLVDDLLVLAKADAQAERHVQSVDLDELVLGQARQLDRTANLHIDVSRVSGGQVAGRDTDLARLVENLSTNAARYAATTIAFSVQQFDDTVELTVTDDGPGIAAEDADRVFERFSTLDDARSPGRAGAGLGLSIVLAIVTAHRGTVRLEHAPGGGALIVVRLPSSESSAIGHRRPVDRQRYPVG